MFLVWDTVLVSDTVFTSGLTQEIISGFDLSLGHSLGLNKVFILGLGQGIQVGHNHSFFDLGFGLGSNLSFILGLGLRTSM